ncbi:hypothetical protein SLEP1_g27062 [Rubroshorea leprosula]|uniref:Uncharacterized protein n=1 Tax=Rubroshorea leprosula TaxID=152421 RepID=A0AAV5JPA6_9ROSI|nr:hypothetical protein SLEP1_g27062 [Rubroshorea leprosula]
MAQEEQSKCSNSAGSDDVVGIGGRSSKRKKPKKVPQRGLGVAQLEKIRLEEQQKKDAVVAAAAAILPCPFPTTISPSQKSPYLPLPIPAFHHPSDQAPSTRSIPFHGDLSPANSMFRPNPYTQNIDLPLPYTPLARPPGAVTGRRNVQKFWSISGYNLEKENSGVDPGLAFRGNFNLPYDSEPIWPLPSLMQRAHQYKQPSSALVNISTTSSPSLLNFHMEPPSNQNYYRSRTVFCSEEETMAGMKRSFPFCLDNPAGPCFHNKYPPITHPTNRSDEQASSGNGNTINFDPSNPIFREGLPCSTSTLKPNPKKSFKENGIFKGDFLTLAPPTSTLMSPSSKSKHPPPNSHLYNLEFPDFITIPYHQGCLEDPVIGGRPGILNPQLPYYSFFPAALVQVGQATTTMTTCNGGEVGESVDLNLKL